MAEPQPFPAPVPAYAEEAPQPPVNYEAEQAMLAAILHDNRAYEEVAEFLRGDHFADPVHGRIYTACGRLIDRGDKADAITLKNAFEADGALQDVGGAQYLAELQSAYVLLQHAPQYGRAVFDLHLRRQLLWWSQEVSAASTDVSSDGDAVSLIERLEYQLGQLAETGSPDSRGLAPAHRHTEAARQEVEHAFVAYGDGRPVGLPTGFRDLDNFMPLSPGMLTTIAGRPGMGKTALALNIADNAVRRGETVAFFSLEMPGRDLFNRLAARNTGVHVDNIVKGSMDVEGYRAVDRAIAQYDDLPLHIDDSGDRVISAMRARARRLKRRHGLSLVIVDYLQLMDAEGKRYDNRVQEISQITRDMKKLAKELGCPILLLSQLSRAVEQRQDKRPQLSDLRESGSIEQDSDNVVLCYRRAYYLKEERPENGDEEQVRAWEKEFAEVHDLCEVNIAKQRQGPTGRRRLTFNDRTTSFRDRD